MNLTSVGGGALMIVIGFVGLIPLLIVVFQILYFRQRFTPYRYLVLSKLTADGLELLLVMMLLVASQLILREWIPTEFRPIIGYLAIALQYSSFYTSIAMTINRLLAVLYPFEYESWFKAKTTVSMVVICWLLAWIHNLVYLKPECGFTFDPQYLRFFFSEEWCGQILSLYQDLLYNVILALLITAIDIFSLIRLKNMSKKTQIPRSSKRETPWFLQATINSSLYVLMLGSFHIANVFTGTTMHFFLTVVAWQIWLSTTPYCVIILQKEFHTFFHNFWRRTVKRKQTSISHLSSELRSKM